MHVHDERYTSTIGSSVTSTFSPSHDTKFTLGLILNNIWDLFPVGNQDGWNLDSHDQFTLILFWINIFLPYTNFLLGL